MKRHDCNKWEATIEAMMDGELTASERVQLEREIAQCDQCRARVDALQEMGALVRLHIQTAVDSVPFDSLWSRIEAGIETQAAELTDLQLQALADGELKGRTLIETTERLAASPSARRRLEAIAEMGDLVRSYDSAVVDSTDFNPLWQRLDRAVGDEIEARGGFRLAPTSQPEPRRIGWFDRILAAIGGYRSILLSAATAALVALILVPILNRGGDSHSQDPGSAPAITQGDGSWTNPQQLEIRVVHVNEVVSNPGHQVTVDSYDGYAPVIYIRSEEDRQEENGTVIPTMPGFYPDPI
ncbi:MAG: hypothetical protein JW797_06005 [Bradymonadales bacterium]|nr:hypothetical protein [Bradymonadales bacterium]